jgi:hypothetical protein
VVAVPFVADHDRFRAGSPCVGIIPAVDTLISIAGYTKPATAVTNITLADLTLQHAGDGGEARFHSYAGGPAAIVLLGPMATGVTIARCELQHGGGNGVLVEAAGVSGVAIDSSTIKDLGGEGISVSNQDTSDVLISNNEVGETGQIYMLQPAIIRLKGKSNIVVTNNNVHHGPYGGIMIGWEKPGMATPSSAVFHIRYNHVHDCE